MESRNTVTGQLYHSLYVSEEFVGGCDIIKEMFEKKELQKLFEDKGVNFKK
jgi:monothiol glutaredoxin